jgi:outer membrane protein
MALAERNAPQAVQARGQIRAGRAALRSAYGAFIPNLTLSAGGSRVQGDITGRVDPTTGRVISGTTPWNYSNAFTASLTLFDGGRRFYDVAQARADIAAAEAAGTTQEYTVALSVAQQYYNALAARESESAARTQLREAQTQLTSTAARVRAGAATRSDSLRALVQVGNARLALLTAQNDLRVANASLTRLVAAPFQVTPLASDTLDRPATLPDSATLAALAERGPAVRQAEAQRESARAVRRAARAPYLPTLDASFSRGGVGTDNFYAIGTNDFRYTNTLRLSLSYPLFNQFTREEQVVRADVAEENAEAALRDARLLAQQSLVQALGAARTAQERVEIQTVSVAAAEEDLRVQQQRYNLGASTLLDVLTSETQLNAARADLIRARYDLRVARAQIEALIGRTLQ